MSNYFSDDIIREVESRIDIVDLIAETTAVTRKGNNFWAICPFHQEKTPSFSISRNKQMFYCFGCHIGGNVFTFLMKKEGLTFPEALKKLAHKTGVTLPDKQAAQVSDDSKLFNEVNELALEYFKQQLLTPDGENARIYLQKRGVNAETIQAFELGYAGKEWRGLSDFLISKGVMPEVIVKLGLLKKSSQSDRYFDLFRNRLIFPIFANTSAPIAFGGRALGDNIPKYLNSPETFLFSKRRHLYGLKLARPHIREENQVILVEGYMDCLKMHQYGFKNTVASLGTALTPEQTALIQRYTENVLVLYDGDSAGQRETLRAIDLLSRKGLKAYTATLPDGMDPDDMLKTGGAANMRKFLQFNRVSSLEFKLRYHLAESSLLNLSRKVEIIELVQDDFFQLDSIIEKDFFIDLLVRQLRIPEVTVRRELKRLAQTNQKNSSRKTLPEKYTISERILAAMLANPAIFKHVHEAVGLDIFIGDAEQELLSVAEQLLIQTDHDLLEMLKLQSNGKSWEILLARLITIIDRGQLAQKPLIRDFVYRVHQAQKQHKWKKLASSINLLEKKGDFKEILNYITRLHKHAHR